MIDNIRKICGFMLQAIAFIIISPALLLILVGGYIMDIGDTLRV